MEVFQTLCCIAIIIFALYYFFTSTFDFWKSRGVRGPQPIPGFGNLKDVLLKKITKSDYLSKLYSHYKDEPFIGIFFMREPILIVKDPHLLKDIFIKDFNTFSERGFVAIHEKTEPLSQNLFNLEIKRWRPLRLKLTPIFTSHKLKEMFGLMTHCANHLIDYIEEITKNKNEPVEILDLMAKYTTDVIGSCVFGIEINSLSNKDNEFRRIGKNVFRQPLSDIIRTYMRIYSPWLFDTLGYILPQTEITKFFIRLVIDTMNYREKNNVTRHDFIDVLRELKKHKLEDIDFTDGFIASQAFVFFAAGFETSSTVMTNTLYELALNQKIQDKLRKEIDEEYIKHGDDSTYDPTYEDIKKMSYLDKIFKETLRKYPPALYFMRTTSSSYTFNGTEVNIPKNQKIWIPVFALQRDPHIYPEPNVFDPERFNEEAVQNRHPMYFMPFGHGPKTCIGSRFAIYQSKLGLIKILRNYKFEPCEKTEIPIVFNEETFIMSPKNGLYLNIIKINHD